MVMRLTYGGGSGSREFSLDIDGSDRLSRQEALEQISKPVAGVHGLAKRIPAAAVAQALSNEPFEDYPRAVYGYKRACGEGGEAKDRFNQSYVDAVEGFLRQTYNSLTFIPEISFDINNISEWREVAALTMVITRYRFSNMRSEADSLTEAYHGLRALRRVFKHVGRYNDITIETLYRLDTFQNY